MKEIPLILREYFVNDKEDARSDAFCRQFLQGQSDQPEYSTNFPPLNEEAF